MIRQTLIVAAAVAMAAAPALAQTAPSPDPGSEAWLRMRGEMYSRAPDSEQDPAEVAATARLNAGIAARNAAAAEAETEAAAAFEARNAEWRAEAARLETERV